MSVKIVLLCEDLQTACFMRRFLKKRGWKAHDIREEIAPKGKGAGEQWVRERFPDELLAMRQQGNVTLVVGTDADTMTVEERISTLDKQCQTKGISVRTAQERVIMAIPRRNIETWFAYLRGESVNEDEIYRRYPNEGDCRNDVAALEKMCSVGVLNQPAPSSLLAVCQEFAKLGMAR